jgi:6-pyruvoyl-tetrahydropterin synthase
VFSFLYISSLDHHYINEKNKNKKPTKTKKGWIITLMRKIKIKNPQRQKKAGSS